MTVAHFCLLAACLMPIVCAGIAKAGMFGPGAGAQRYDNRQPRAWLAAQSGYRARANAAQANSFEALPLFVAGLMVAHQTGAPQGLMDGLSVAFVALRVAYVAAYLADRQAARSLVWGLGHAAAVALFFAGAG